MWSSRFRKGQRNKYEMDHETGRIRLDRMRDEMGADDKVLCVVATDPRMAHLRDIEHVSEFDRLEIQHFFEVYKALEPGKEVETATWVGRSDAEAEIHACRARLSASEGGGRH
jgi:inorganic pyrophosphatase